MSMINELDCSADTTVIDAAAERMALKDIEHEEFRDTNEMSGFQRGYSRGFIEGAEFIRSFYRNREMRDHLIPLEREHMKCESEQKKDVVDERLLTPVEKTLKALGLTPQKESFGACLRQVNHSYDHDDPTPPIGGFHD